MIFQAIGKVAVTTPGTPVRVTTDVSIKCARIQFAVDPANTGKTYLGPAGMNKTSKANVARIFTAPGTGPQDGMAVPSTSGEGARNVHTLADYWVDADTATEGLLVGYWVA